MTGLIILISVLLILNLYIYIKNSCLENNIFEYLKSNDEIDVEGVEDEQLYNLNFYKLIFNVKIQVPNILDQSKNIQLNNKLKIFNENFEEITEINVTDNYVPISIDLPTNSEYVIFHRYDKNNNLSMNIKDIFYHGYEVNFIDIEILDGNTLKKLSVDNEEYEKIQKGLLVINNVLYKIKLPKIK